MPPTPRPWQDRFWPKVDVRGPDECWEWKAGKIGNGYGCHGQSPREEPRDTLAHRLSWIMAHGPIPDGMLVLHHCDNPACVNPAHLWLGTQRQNIRDMVRKNRQQQRSRSGKATLSEDQVAEIRRRYAEGDTIQVALADDYGVNRQTISKIVNNQRWSEAGGDVSIDRYKNPARAKDLSKKDLDRIRRRWWSGSYTQTELGKMFGISQSRVSRIVRQDT